MNTREAFNLANDLKWFYLKIYDKDNPDTYEEIQVENVTTIEIKYERNNPRIVGELIFKDLTDINFSIDWTKAKIEIYFQDFFDEFYLRRFEILNIQDLYYNRIKSFKIQFQDEISWKLQNTYISKGFKEPKVSAFQKYFDHLDLETVLTETNIIKEFEIDVPTKHVEFVVPKSTNLLDFFITEFNKIGFVIYQDRKGLRIKDSKNLYTTNLELNEEIFTNEALNQLYKNKIFDSAILYNNKKELNLKPKTEMNYYDFESKSNKTFTDLDYSSNSLMNEKFEDLKETESLKSSFQNRLDDLEYVMETTDSYLEYSNLEILVNGYNERDINTLIKIKLMGNIGSVQSMNDGNKLVSGTYLITSVVDKFVGGKLIQKLHLKRADYN